MKAAIVSFTNMAVSSREWKPRIAMKVHKADKSFPEGWLRGTRYREGEFQTFSAFPVSSPSHQTDLEGINHIITLRIAFTECFSLFFFFRILPSPKRSLWHHQGVLWRVLHKQGRQVWLQRGMAECYWVPQENTMGRHDVAVSECLCIAWVPCLGKAEHLQWRRVCTSYLLQPLCFVSAVVMATVPITSSVYLCLARFHTSPELVCDWRAKRQSRSNTRNPDDNRSYIS